MVLELTLTMLEASVEVGPYPHISPEAMAPELHAGTSSTRLGDKGWFMYDRELELLRISTERAIDVDRASDKATRELGLLIALLNSDDCGDASST